MTPRTLIALYKIANLPPMGSADLTQASNQDRQPQGEDAELKEAEVKGTGKTPNADTPAPEASAESRQASASIVESGLRATREALTPWDSGIKQLARQAKLSGYLMNKFLKYSGLGKKLQQQQRRNVG